jgi:hypothetical protein
VVPPPPQVLEKPPQKAPPPDTAKKTQLTTPAQDDPPAFLSGDDFTFSSGSGDPPGIEKTDSPEVIKTMAPAGGARAAVTAPAPAAVVTKPKSVPDWKAASAGPAPARAPRPPRKPLLTEQRLKVGGLVLGVVLLLGGLAFGIYRLVKPETPEQARERIHKLIGDEKYAEALEKTDGTNALGEDEKKELRTEIAEAWLKQIGEPNNNNAERVEGQLAEYLERFPKDEGAKSRRVRAVGLHIPPKALALADKGKYEDAYALLHGRPELAGNEAARKAEEEILRQWVTSAESLLAEDKKDYEGADQVARAILDKKSGYVRAEQVRQRARDAIKAVTQKRDACLNKHDFAGAYQVVLADWPRKKQLRDQIAKKWTDWVNTRDEAGLKREEAALAALLKKHPADEAANKVKARIEVRGKQFDIGKGITAARDQASLLALADKLKGLPELDRKDLPDRLSDAAVKLSQASREPKADANRAQLEKLEKLLAGGPKKKISNELARIDAIVDVGGALAGALRAIGGEDLGRAETFLKDLRTQLKPDDKETLTKVEGLLDAVALARKAKARPTGDDVDKLGKVIAELKGTTPEERAALDRLHARLLDRRIQASIPTLPGSRKWDDWLADCDKIKDSPTDWVLACRLECLDGLEEVSRDRWQTALAPLEGRALDPLVKPYADYGRALADWRREQPQQAARRLMAVVRDGKLPGPLAQDARRQKVVQILQEAAESLRAGDTIKEPYGSAAGADSAFAWLEQAVKLANEPSPSLRANLTLAAYAKTSPDREQAAELASGLVDRKQLGGLSRRADAYRVLLIHVRTRPPDAPGRKAALAGYAAAVDSVRPLLLPKGRSLDVADHVFQNVIKPACEEGAQLLGPSPDAGLEADYVRLCARLARLLKEDVTVWSKLDNLPGGHPLRPVAQLYGQAAAHAPVKTREEKGARAEYLVMKGFALSQLPGTEPKTLNDLADEAKRLAEDYPGGYGLRGIVLISESRARRRLKDKMPLLEGADKQLNDALDRLKNVSGEGRRELGGVLNQAKAAACVELANYASDKVQKQRYLEQAKRYSQAALDLDARNLEAWETRGCVLEDVAWLLGKADEYKAACDAFDRAKDLGSLAAGKTKPWLGRGRTLVKWVEKDLGDGRPLAAAEARLKKAVEDLGVVTQWSAGSVEAAEAHFWQARIHGLRSKPAEADQEYRKALQAARQQKSDVWVEVILTARGVLAATEADRRQRDKVAGAANYLKIAEAQAKDLEAISKPRWAMITIRVLRTRAALNRDPVDWAKLVDLLNKGLTDTRVEDALYRADLFAQRADLLSRGIKDVLDRDRGKAYEDASEALKLIAENHLEAPATKAHALGTAGAMRVHASVDTKLDDQTRAAHHKEALSKLREAISLAPGHGFVGEWKLFLATALFTKPGGTAAEKANSFEEACRNVAEAGDDLKRGGLDMNYPELPRLREAIEKQALPVLREAVTNSPQSDDAWRWHWRIAELLKKETDSDSKREAAASIRKAKAGVPPTAPPAVKERIEALRKELVTD